MFDDPGSGINNCMVGGIEMRAKQSYEPSDYAA